MQLLPISCPLYSFLTPPRLASNFLLPLRPLSAYIPPPPPPLCPTLATHRPRLEQSQRTREWVAPAEALRRCNEWAYKPRSKIELGEGLRRCRVFREAEARREGQGQQ